MTTLTTPPVVPPYWASKPLLCTCTSATCTSGRDIDGRFAFGGLNHDKGFGNHHAFLHRAYLQGNIDRDDLAEGDIDGLALPLPESRHGHGEGVAPWGQAGATGICGDLQGSNQRTGELDCRPEQECARGVNHRALNCACDFLGKSRTHCHKQPQAH